MKVFETNAALSYDQLAFLIRLNKSKNGYNYLCVGTKDINNDSYQIGNVVEDLEDYYVEISKYDICESPLYNSFLFDFFIKNYNILNKHI